MSYTEATKKINRMNTFGAKTVTYIWQEIAKFLIRVQKQFKTVEVCNLWKLAARGNTKNRLAFTRLQ